MRIIVFLIAVSVLPVSFASDGEVLWWTVGTDYESITAKNEADGSVTTAGALGVTDVRVRYDSDDGESGYLTILGLNDDGSVSVYDGSAGFGGAAGMGLPAEYFGDLSGISGSSYSFVIELGNYIDGSWARTSMESESVDYNTLVARGHISVWNNEPPEGRAWSPANYSVVPEPSSGILLLVGGALLALRRRRGV